MKIICMITIGILILFLMLNPSLGTDEDCMMCHEEKTMFGSHGKSLYVDEEQYQKSIHGQKGLACIDCHTALKGVLDYPHTFPLRKVDCSICHEREGLELSKSIHAFVSNTGKDTPDCSDCHGRHNILGAEDPGSLMYPLNQPDACLKCHANIRIANKYHIKGEKFVNQFKESVHGKALKEAGLIISAVCSACHGSHLILPHQDQASPVHRMRIPKTCSKCHAGIYKDYIEGVHGEDYLQGNRDVPVCTDCHTEHNIRPPSDKESSIYATHIDILCSRCHDDEKISREYGLASSRLKTFLGSYHGIALEYGDIKVAHCASCHGYHNIRPSSDPESPIHPSNIPRTCGKCHPRAGINYAKGTIHDFAGKENNLVAYLVRKFYIVFISLLVGSFVLFITVDLFSRWRKRPPYKGRSKRNDASV